ncbi:MAG: hypothetical protein ACFCVC_06815 [Acidimicrobiia bacterium]
MYEIVVDPLEVASGAGGCRRASVAVSAAAEAFRRPLCLVGPVGTSLALSAFDQRFARFLDGTAALLDDMGVELAVVASLHRAFEDDGA